MTLCVVVLIASEFLPVSLLTPIARDFGLTERQAGQAIAISGLFAVVTSLLMPTVVGATDRRLVVIGMALLLAVSGMLVALAPNFLVLMIGRALLGVAIRGFWSLNTPIIMRLPPAALVLAGLAVSDGGVAFASTVSAPLGSYMGELVGWRWTFLSVANGLASLVGTLLIACSIQAGLRVTLVAIPLVSWPVSPLLWPCSAPPSGPWAAFWRSGASSSTRPARCLTPPPARPSWPSPRRWLSPSGADFAPPAP